MKVRDLLRELNVEIAPAGHHHVSNGWVGIDCCHCSPKSGRFRLGIPEDSGGWATCWVCGPKRLVDMLAEATGEPVRKILALVKDHGGLETDSPRAEIKAGGKFLPPEGVGPLLRAHRRYLEDRRLDPDEVASLWGVQGIGVAPRCQWSLFIPVRLGTEPVSWTTRSIGSTGQRYKTAEPHEEKVHVRNLLYGEENARHAIVVVEGAPDVWSIGPGGVGTLGTGFSQSQVLRMSKYPVRVVVFNAEPDAQRRARNLCKVLKVFQGDTFNVVLETGKDVNDCLRSRAGRREVRTLQRRFLT